MNLILRFGGPSRANPGSSYRPAVTSYEQQRTFSLVPHGNVRSIGAEEIGDTTDAFSSPILSTSPSRKV